MNYTGRHEAGGGSLMRNAMIRAARTVFQSILASLGVILIDAVTDVTILTDTGRWALLGLQAGIALVSFLQNWLEETAGVGYDRG
jgi:hypothetical protein